MILLAVLSPTRPLAAQNWSVVGGALGGVGAGAWVGLGYLTVRARGGAYLDTPGYKARQVGARNGPDPIESVCQPRDTRAAEIA